MVTQDNESSPPKPLLTIHNIPIHFSESWNTGIGGGIWSTGWAMAKYFECHSDDISRCFIRLSSLKQLRRGANFNYKQSDGISAIELGSGNGFLSVCLLAAVSNHTRILKKLVVTDMADHLGLMQSTINANSHVVDQLQTVDVSVKEHVWGTFNDNDVKQQKYDFIFGTDLAYRDYLYEPLISSLLHFSHEHTVSLIGVTMNDTRPKFFDMLREAGFRYERLAGEIVMYGFFCLQL
jgi:hypothetical protein